MSELHFEEFQGRTVQDWLQLVSKELGERSVESLSWECDQGISLSPYYTLSGNNYALAEHPVAEQFQLIRHTDGKEWNRLALESLMGGTTSIGLDCTHFAPGDMEVLLEGVEVSYISLSFLNMHSPSLWVKAFAEHCDKHGVDRSLLKGAFWWTDEMTSGVEALKNWHSTSRAFFPRYRVVVIDAVEVHELGASVLQELSWALAAGHHTLSRCIEAGIPIDEASALVQFNFAVSSSYFVEIAKLRAFRWCWKRIVQSYAPDHACSAGTHVHASTSRYLQTAKDFNNNLLRATTQAMSAIVGGADAIDVVPHTSWQSTHDENALRLARNIHQLLLEESYFSTFRNAADGAFYIEQLTDQLVMEGWKRFQNLDTRFATDGAAQARQWHREQVRLHEHQQQQRVSEGKRVVVGVNRYVNKADPIVVGGMAHTLSAPFEKE